MSVFSQEHVDLCPAKNNPEAECRCEINGVYCRCMICRRAYSKSETPWEDGKCPECSTDFTPLHPTLDVTIKANWLELKTIAWWAEQYITHCGYNFPAMAPQMLKALYAITEEIENQNPLLAPLTQGKELGIVQQNNPNLPFDSLAIQPVKPKYRLQ